MAAQDEATRAIIEEKADEIEQLKSELADKRSQLQETQDLVSDLKEELEIIQKKHLQLQGDRDLLLTKNKDQRDKMMKQMQDIEDRDGKIEQLQATLEIATSAKNFIKKSQEAAVKKLERIKEDNFLIPEKKEEEKKEVASDQAETNLNAILQNELRQVHFKLRQNDQIIEEFKREAQAYYT